MIRNKTPTLIAAKRSARPNANFRARPLADQSMLEQPRWFEEYYREKETLEKIVDNSTINN